MGIRIVELGLCQVGMLEVVLPVQVMAYFPLHVVRELDTAGDVLLKANPSDNEAHDRHPEMRGIRRHQA